MASSPFNINSPPTKYDRPRSFPIEHFSFHPCFLLHLFIFKFLQSSKAGYLSQAAAAAGYTAAANAAAVRAYAANAAAASQPAVAYAAVPAR